MGKLLQSLAISSSLTTSLVIVVSGILIFLFSFDSYPHRLWLFIPWICSVLGVMGIIGHLKIHEPESKNEAIEYAVFLIIGMAGWVTLAALFYGYVLPFFSYPDITSTFNYYLAVTVFPVIPVLTGLLFLIRSRAWLYSARLPQKGRHPRILIIGFMAPACLVLLRVLMQEGIIYWYGHDLAERVERSAERIAQGEAYCFIRGTDISGIQDLNARKLISDALDMHFGLNGIVDTYRQPHFGILVDGLSYWWSFREGRFVMFYLYRREGRC